MVNVKSQSLILVTGGSGLLGGELKKILPDSLFPSSQEFDVTDYNQMEAYIANHQVQVLLHAAAFTSPPKIDTDPLRALDVNVMGTAQVVKLCMRHNIKLIYMSTDYVFEGDVGNYSEDDAVQPVNKYAWSKLGGECAVRLYDNSLIIRTSFGPAVFPYEKAFTDQWTSRESVDKIAKKIVNLLQASLTGIIHIGGKRQTVYEYAKSLDPQKNIGQLSIKDVNFKAPADTSLNTKKYESLNL